MRIKLQRSPSISSVKLMGQPVPCAVIILPADRNELPYADGLINSDLLATCKPIGRGHKMPKLRVHCFAISLDGYGAGPNQDLDNPLGVGGGRTARMGICHTYLSTDDWQ